MFSTKVCAKYSLEEFKGPVWVLPPLERAMKELKSEGWYEDPTELDASARELTDKDVREIYPKFRVETFSPTEAKKIDVSDSGHDLPKEWLLDPKAKPNHEFDDRHRYSSKHHETVLKAMREGKELDMPFVLKLKNGTYYAMGGRHRIVYAINLGLTLKCAVIDSKDWYLPAGVAPEKVW